MAVILFLSSRSSLPSDSTAVSWIGQYTDEVGHLGEYAILGMLAYATLRSRLERRGAAILGLTLCVAFSLGDEAFQGLISNRTPQAMDLLFDAVGATGGLVFLAYLVPGLRRFLSERG